MQVRVLPSQPKFMKCAYWRCKNEVIGYGIRGKRFCSNKCKVRTNVIRKRQRLKSKAIEYLGGKCCKCGYNKCQAVLQFYHTDPNKKDFGLSARGFCRSWKKIKEELDKCLLMCANCHTELHAEEEAKIRGDIQESPKGMACGC